MVNLMLSIGYPYHKILNGLIIFGNIYVSYGVYQAWYGFLPFDLAEYTLRIGAKDALISSFFGDMVRPFGFALTNGHFFYSIVIILLFLIPQLKIMTKIQRVMTSLFIFLNLMLFLKSPERTAIAMIGIGLVVMYFIVSNSSKPFKVFIFFSCIVLAFLGIRSLVLPILKSVGINLYWYRVFELFDLFNAETFVTRAGESGNWSAALERIMHRPILGYGTGTGTFTRLGSIAGVNNYSTHNEFLSIALELGIMGLLVFIYMIFKIYGKIVLLSKLNDHYKFIAAGIGAALMAQLACSMFNIALLSGESSRLVWLMVGILPALLNNRINFITHYNQTKIY